MSGHDEDCGDCGDDDANLLCEETEALAHALLMAPDDEYDGDTVPSDALVSMPAPLRNHVNVDAATDDEDDQEEYFYEMRRRMRAEDELAASPTSPARLADAGDPETVNVDDLPDAESDAAALHAHRVLEKMYEEERAALGLSLGATPTTTPLDANVVSKVKNWFKNRKTTNLLRKQGKAAQEKAKAEAALKRADATEEEARRRLELQEESRKRKADHKAKRLKDPVPPLEAMAPNAPDMTFSKGKDRASSFLAQLLPTEQALAQELARLASAGDVPVPADMLKQLQAIGRNDWFTMTSALASALATVRVDVERTLGRPVSLPALAAAAPASASGTGTAPLATVLNAHAAALQTAIVRAGMGSELRERQVALERGRQLGEALVLEVPQAKHLALLGLLSNVVELAHTRAIDNAVPQDGALRMRQFWATKVDLHTAAKNLFE
jgi:hypothetical protein